MSDLYKESDFVDTVTEDGEEGPRVPKSWIGTEYAEGLKKKGRSSGSRSAAPATPEASTPAPPEAPAPTEVVEPAGNGSREEWAAYATSKGASEEDLFDDDGNELGRDALRAKFGTPAS